MSFLPGYTYLGDNFSCISLPIGLPGEQFT
jgi:hypothetical protein